MDSSYKNSKEAFISGMAGSSIGHINMVSLAALSSIALYSAMKTRLFMNKSMGFLVEFVILVVPLLLSVTLFARSPGQLTLILLSPTGLLLLMSRGGSGVVLPSSSNSIRVTKGSGESGAASQGREKADSPPVRSFNRLPALTTYRAHMLLLTFLCILAVDFPVFPRMLAKCETFGVSLMDLGVGSFVFSQGIISAMPVVKNPAHLTEPLVAKVLKVIRKCYPLFVLGLFRTLSVKGVEYPEHQTEYGTHWNFFFTLGFIPILQVLLHPLMVGIPISLLAVLVALLQQVALSNGLMSYVFKAPRVNLVSSNKEGIVSLSGYLAIHLLGLYTGTIVLPPSPSYFRRCQKGLSQPKDKSGKRPTHEHDESKRKVDNMSSGLSSAQQTNRENDKTAIELCAYSVLWWTLLGCTMLLDIGGGVSRRLVNLQYILWVAAYNTSFLLGYLVLDLLFFASPSSRSRYSPYSKLKVKPDPAVLSTSERTLRAAARAPPLLEAINHNGLVLFLLANLATGLVNLTMPTMYMSDPAAMAVLSLYSLTICGVAWTSRNTKLWTF
ncbi:uncharacterized protein LAESUDRAFT_757895 [Laetiporus sulphureus 93-53]|uniref:GPI-anchored wall transfer protein n=1 Tax=Laetiporus sulphureus 93-53 TaxID=1314785 RepID=A0A165F248_9APHY|nr:uncharacterized protein LAESUDRAFT_757895 [Laetiporus sulphureus 93-53]KZT08215.1 hypothetical protein LAESUDRAFT_757895 [Laetiporus sulphureus 93-53]